MATEHLEPALTLSEAAGRLGVHPATLRRWADRGDVQVVKTPGGHRRFPESEIQRLIRPRDTALAPPGTMTERAIGRTRDELRQNPHARWMSETDEGGREEKRLLGRKLVGLMMQFVAAENGDGEELLQEARVIGRIYGKSAIMSKIELSDALKATMFFRDNLVESALLLPESVRSRPEASARLYRRINEFLNTVQLSIAEVYDRTSDA